MKYSNYDELLAVIGRKQFDPVQEELSMTDLEDIYAEVWLDPGFQRLGGVMNQSGWTYEQSCKYIDNLLKGKTHNAIMLADVDRCCEFAEKQGDLVSYEYFKDKRDKGYSYVSVDGNNTHSTIWAFVSGVPTPENGPIVSKWLKEICPDTEGSFTGIKDPAVRRKLSSNRKTKVIYLREASLEEMCELFRDLNTSEPLNAHERRQARLTDLAVFVRKVSVKFEETFLKVFKKINKAGIDQRKSDVFVAELCLKLQSNYCAPLSSKKLDVLYRDTEYLNPEIEKKVWHVLSTFEKFSKKLEDDFTGLLPGEVHAAAETIMLIHDMGYKINDHFQFFKWFLEHNMRFVKESRNTLASSENREEDVSYKYWLNRPARSGSYKRVSAVWTQHLNNNIENLCECGLLSKLRTSRDVFRFDQKIQALVAQNFKDRDGKEIPVLDFYCKNKLHADHVVSVKDGGQTTLSNCEIMSAENNLKKGASSWEPHFDHQLDQEKHTFMIDNK